jgi:hypothetical protein
MTLHPDFVTMIATALPEEVRAILIKHGPNLCVAGGFCRDTLTGHDPKDIDVFSVSRVALDEAIGKLNVFPTYGYEITPNTETFICDGIGPDIQFITRTYLRDHYNAILSFDFSICQVGIWYDQEKGWIGMASDAFLEDLPKFRMRYMAPDRDEDPGASIMRAFKFSRRGFDIDDDEFAKRPGILRSGAGSSGGCAARNE